MTLDAKTLYRDTVLDHGNRPRNEGPLPGATHEATVDNPLCGDRVTVRLRADDAGRLLEVRFEARGCLIARASASLLTELAAGRTREEALALARALDDLVEAAAPPLDAGALEPLRGVREFPARKACATLAWKALERALAR
ncbi:MAG TPA: SUF system NifU family Fe-S cluster assembly protein [Polyangiaceae bacterium]|nr:SUF system NifU family Fe-S cluster assembly protein [Polyangiaceae bacterium]